MKALQYENILNFSSEKNSTYAFSLFSQCADAIHQNVFNFTHAYTSTPFSVSTAFSLSFFFSLTRIQRNYPEFGVNRVNVNVLYYTISFITYLLNIKFS